MSESNCSTGTGHARSLQPFADTAPTLAAMGLVPLPVGFDKRPAVGNWQRFTPNTHKRLLDRFGAYNVGVVNGRGRLPITILDIDDLSERDWCREWFGDSPAKVRTASGGEHWYFAWNGEKRRTRIEGRKVDVLGSNGFGVLPPSHTPKGDYEWVEGDADALYHLPTMRAAHKPTQAAQPSQMAEGDGRNNTLFRAMLAAAANLSNHADLLAEARASNNEFAEPMSDDEVQKVVGNVWRYKEEDRLLIPGCESSFVLRDSLVERCLQCPDALALLAKVKKLHGSKGGAPFALPEATGPQIMGWSRNRFRRARDHLISIGELHVVRAGEQGRRQPTVVRLRNVQI